MAVAIPLSGERFQPTGLLPARPGELMMFELKVISRDAIPEALAKAERYRLLNEPVEAESICHDVLQIEPDNQEALVTLLLAITDQFESGLSPKAAKDIIPQLRSEYERCYFSGIICERQARGLHRHGGFGSGFGAYESYREAMAFYEKAEALRPAGTDDAIIRWNTCARILMRDSNLRPRPEGAFEPILSE
jgi:hypothetical protein